MYLGIDVGGTKIAAALIDDSGSLSERLREKIDQATDRSALEQVKAIVRKFRRPELRGIGMGVPGIADQRKRTVWCPNIRGWEHVALFDELESQSSVPVVIESDRNTAILGEVLFGAAKGRSDAIFLILGTGIGAGVVSEAACCGVLMRSRERWAGYRFCFGGS